MTHLNDIDNLAPADSLKAGADTLNTWRGRLDTLNDALGDITSSEADQIEAIGTVTISNTQWGYLGACVAGGGQLLAALTTGESTQLEAIGTTTITATQWGYLGACTVAGGAILDDADASAQRTTLGLAIGTNVLAYDAGLSNLAGISMAADKFYYTSADNTHVAGTITAFGRSIIDDADEATFKGTVNLEIGTDVQAYDADLSAIAALAKTDGNFIVGNGSTWVAESGATARTSLGLGSMAIQAHGSVNIDGGTIGGITLDGAIAGGDQAFTGVGDMTFTNGSILAAASANTNTLLVKAGGLAGTSVITITSLDAGDTIAFANVTGLVATGPLDIGAQGFRANTLTADGLTATRVVFAGTAGLLSDSSAFTFVTDTLTVTKLGAFEATGAINFGNQAMTNVDINSGTINGITDLAVADGGTGSSTAANARTALGLAIGTNVLAQQTIGIADNNLMEVDDTDAASTDYARFTATGLQGRDATEAKTDLGLVIGTNIQAWDTQLDDIAALAHTDSNFIVGDGNNWVAESGTTALASLGLAAELDNLTSGEVGQLEAIGTTTISANQWAWLGGYSINASARAYLAANQIDITNGVWTRIELDTESHDPGTNFNNGLLGSGTADGTTGGHLIDSGYDFAAVGIAVGMRVKNTNDTTYTYITAVAVGDLTLRDDIFVSGEGWEVQAARYVVPVTGYYPICGAILYTGVVADRVWYIGFYKNGALMTSANLQSATTDNQSISNGDIEYLEADDYIELWTYHAAGANTPDIIGSEAATYLAISFISN